MVGDDRISKYQFGKKLANHFELDSSFITKGLLSEQNKLVERPLDMSLSNNKISTYLHSEIGGVDEQLEILRQQDNNGISAELNQL